MAAISKLMIRNLILIFVLSGILSVSFINVHAQTIHDSEGVRWERTLRIQGVIQETDPFSESMLYDLADSQGEAIQASPENVHFEVVASHFWFALRDSIDHALQEDRIAAYSVRELPDRDGIFVGDEQLTYEEILDMLSVNLNEAYDPDDAFTQILDLNFNENVPYWQFIEDLQFDAEGEEEAVAIEGEGINRFIFDLSFMSLYELEVKFRVDETGFDVIPQSLLLGTAMYDGDDQFDPDDMLMNMRSDFANGVGVYLDLTEEETVNFLIETGAQFTGETNEIPFYDLMTIFHYDFSFYAESNHRLGAAGDFGHDVQNVFSTIMNRYVDFAYTQLYGQPPTWWQLGERGHFIHGLFESTLEEHGQGQVPEFEEGEQDEFEGVDDF